ncbi:MAG TPA: hypothetical protein VHE55_18970 [Fimbriimonadaceae bacterium]|nr:hypothetical protein [Fimbriimonadaceae bacterium]
MRCQCLVSVSLILLISACAGVPQNHPTAAAREWSKGETLVEIKDKRIDESSGICASRTEDGIYYTHNDSGDVARFFRFDRKGQILAVFNVTNAAKAVDWEDIASATVGGKPYIYCGDIGDNKEVRKQIYVYRVPEPPPGGNGEDKPVQADRVYTLTYPDHAHNAETLMVNPANGDIYIVTKTSKKPSKVYKLAHPGVSGTYVLKRIGEIEVGAPGSFGHLITGGDISPDSKHVVVRTYVEALEYDVSANFDDWFEQTPRHVRTNFEFQGEGICYSRNGQALLTTSEGSPCQVSEGNLKGAAPGKNN